MITLKNFAPYTPKKTSKDSFLLSFGVAFLKDENGNDWYESQLLFSPDTLKIAFYQNGIICSSSYDVTTLNPVGMSVSEVEKDLIPDGFNTSGDWVFDGENIVQRVRSHDELVSEAESTKKSLLNNASYAMAPLQDAVDLGKATDEERNTLLSWKEYRVSLLRIDTAQAPDIEWPSTPETSD